MFLFFDHPHNGSRMRRVPIEMRTASPVMIRSSSLDAYRTQWLFFERGRANTQLPSPRVHRGGED